MDERVLQFKVGVTVLAMFIILAILIVAFGGIPMPWGQGQYTLFIELPQAPGIAAGTPVRKSGIRIGEVAAVEFTPEGRVLLTVEIDNHRRITRSEVCRIKGTLLGDAIVDFIPGSGPQSSEFLGEGDRIDGVVFSDPLEILAGLEGNLTGALDSINTAGNEAAQLARRIDALVEDNRQKIDRLIVKSETALDGVIQTMGSLDAMFGDEQVQQDMKKGLADLPKLLAEARQAVVRIHQTMATADENLENLKGLTGPLGERGEALVMTIESSFNQLDQLVGQLAIFSRAINNRTGSLGQLVHNPELYQNLNRAAVNIEKISRQLRPIIDDVRIFTDKIARDPGRLGVRGALRQPSGIK